MSISPIILAGLIRGSRKILLQVYNFNENNKYKSETHTIMVNNNIRKIRYPN